MIRTSQGGVVIYIKDTLPHHKREEIYDTNLEIVGVAAVAVQREGTGGLVSPPLLTKIDFLIHIKSMRKC